MYDLEQVKRGKIKNLSNADLSGADLNGALGLGGRSVCPPSGSFTAFKKLRDGIVATLFIPSGAYRVTCLTKRKCRASQAKVVDMGGAVIGVSLHDSDFLYRLGEYVVPVGDFNDDPRIDCASGIHFFMEREEAEAWS